MTRVTGILWATRDASWYSRPDVNTVKKFHRMTAKEMAACSPSTIPLDESVAVDGSTLPWDRMCTRCLRTKAR